jgi:hypothetical protein
MMKQNTVKTLDKNIGNSQSLQLQGFGGNLFVIVLN